MRVTTPADFLRSGLFWRAAITAAREARRLIPLKVVTWLALKAVEAKAGTAFKEGRAKRGLTLFNLEGTHAVSCGWYGPLAQLARAYD